MASAFPFLFLGGLTALGSAFCFLLFFAGGSPSSSSSDRRLYFLTVGKAARIQTQTLSEVRGLVSLGADSDRSLGYQKYNVQLKG